MVLKEGFEGTLVRQRGAAAGGSGPTWQSRGEHALLVEGSLSASRDLFDAAYRQAESAGCADSMARAALGMGGLWVHERRPAAEAASVEARQRLALDLVGPDSVHGLRLRARLAAEEDYRAGRHAGVLAVLAEARQRDDAVVLAEVLSLAHHCLLGPGNGQPRLALVDELLRTAFRTGRPADVLMGLLWRTVDLFLDGDPTAERSLGELREALAREQHLAVGFVASALDVMLAVRGARLEEAETLAARCAERGAAAGDADAAGWHVVQLLAIRWYQGRAAELVPALTELASSPGMGTVDRASIAALAVGFAVAGDRSQAACALARLRGNGFAGLVRSSSWLAGMYGAVETAHILGDEQVAAESYELLHPYAELPMTASLGVACFGSTHQALGVAAMTMRDASRAVDHFRAAVRANQALGHRPAAVVSSHRLGQALACRGQPGDVEAGDAALAVAAVDVAALGIVPARLVVSAGDGATSWPAGRPMPPGLTKSQGLPPPPPPPRLALSRRGRWWHVRLGHRVAQVSDSLGLRYLDLLVTHPGEEMLATELSATVAGTGVASPGPAARQPVLDDHARREYRARLEALSAEIDRHSQRGDLARADKSRAERDWLLVELGAATGLHGQLRHFSDEAERARIAVTKAIRRAIDRVAAVEPVIGDELRRRVQTGVRCCFDAR